MGPARSRARGVGSMRPSRSSKRRSSRRWRSRFKALLIAGWLRPLCRAARVTLRSAIKASNARRRFRLTPRIFLSVIPGIFFFHFLSRDRTAMIRGAAALVGGEANPMTVLDAKVIHAKFVLEAKFVLGGRG